MDEIHKVIGYIPLPYRIFDDRNKSGTVKGDNNNQVYVLSDFKFFKIIILCVNYVQKY